MKAETIEIIVNNNLIFQFKLGDNLPQAIEYFISEHVQMQKNTYLWAETYNKIFIAAIVITREKYPCSFHAAFIANGQKFSLNIGVADDYVNSINYLQAELIKILADTSSQDTLQQITTSLVHESWNVIELILRSTFSDNFITEANLILANESIIFVYDIPWITPTGLGNVLKGLISSMSIHKNTKVRNLDGYILGNYSKVLDARHVFNSLDENLKSESVTTFRFFVFKYDEIDFHNSNIKSRDPKSLKMPDNPLFAPLLSLSFAVDNVFNTSLIPHKILQRLLKAIRRIHFTDDVTNLVADVVDKIERPSLGVSIRSYAAPHEIDENMSSSLRYNYYSYISMIAKLVYSLNVKSILIAFDNPSLLAEYSQFLNLLPVTVHFFLHSPDIDPLVKAAVEMLSLSETDYLLGNNQSSFLEVIYWFGKCRQQVFHPF